MSGNIYKEKIVTENDKLTKVNSFSVMLIKAIICRAVIDCLYDSKYYRRIRVDAEMWIFSKSTKDWSFLWCCEQSDLDPVIIRNKLLTKDPHFVNSIRRKY